MNLQNIIDKLQELDEELIICMHKPWHSNAECILVTPDQSLAVPADVKAAGFHYFLEIFVVLEILEVFDDKIVSSETKIEFIQYYAENDAFPDWDYEKFDRIKT